MIGFGSSADGPSPPTSTPHGSFGGTAAANGSPEFSGNARLVISRGRAVAVHGSLLLFASAILAMAVKLQIVEHTMWARKADRQHVRQQDITPLRGSILDATGSVLVESRDMVRLGLNPKHVRPYRPRGAKRGSDPIDGRTALQRGLRSLGVSAANIRRALDTTKTWVELPTPMLPADFERVADIPGVRRLPTQRRYAVATPPGLRSIIGSVDGGDKAIGGIESELDALLRGQSGRDAFMRDGRGGVVESPELAGVTARAGHTITLTFNMSLQEIAERELERARASTGATGGDVVILDPNNGEVLALAGVRNGKLASNSTPLTEPYEPGSVMKPFVVSRVLDLKRAVPDDVINTENGKAMIANRPLTDEHKAASMTLRDVIRFSSNIGTARLAERLSPQEEYEAMRDFGFGMFTGVPYPAESRGSLALPHTWHPLVPSRLAIGYAIAATPLQIAAAYAAIANGGELVQPVFVRQIRDAEGAVVFQSERRVVRRVISRETAALMREMLEAVVDSGTARAADLVTYDVAGKSGTARRSDGRRGYVAGGYNATFAGMFPAQSPQFVIVARLIDPEGTYFGGVVSGRLVNGILQQALATREASLDRNALSEVAKDLPLPEVSPLSPSALVAAQRDSARRDSLKAPLPQVVEPLPTASRVVVELPYGRRGGLVESTAREGAAEEAPIIRAVPSVYGLDLRQATRTLSAAGFQVGLVAGMAGRTRPAAGAFARVGSTVQLEMPR